MSARLDTLTNVVTVAALLVIAGIAVLRYLDQRDSSDVPEQSVSPYAQGETMEQLGAVEYKKARATLILFVRSTCRFCTDSMPFYRQILDLEAARSRALQVVAASYEAVDVTKAYLKAHEVDVESVVSIAPGTAKFQGTPTVVLVDTSGRVIREWRGLLPPNSEVELRSAIVTATAGVGDTRSGLTPSS